MKANKTIEIFDIKLYKPSVEIKGFKFNIGDDKVEIYLSFLEENSYNPIGRVLYMPVSNNEVSTDKVIGFTKSQLTDFE